MHSLKELKRQEAAARSKMAAAKDAYSKAVSARKELELNEFIKGYEQKGIVVGSKVKVILRGGGFKVCFVHSFENSFSPSVALCLPKKDGTPGKSKRWVPFERLELVEGQS